MGVGFGRGFGIPAGLLLSALLAACGGGGGGGGAAEAPAEKAETRLVADRSSLQFGTLAPGARSAPQVVRITNAGTAAVTLAPRIEGAQAGAFRAEGCSGTLQPAAQCILNLSFAPVAAGAQQASLRLGPEPLILTLAGTALPPPPASPGTGFRAAGGQIIDPSGSVVRVRGLNMYGFNADILIPQYLWTMGWKAQIAQVKNLGFNAIRVPFVPDTLYVTKPGYFDPGKNPEFVGKTPLQILDLWLAELDRQGLYFVLDFHSVTRHGLHNSWHTKDGSITWNGQPYTEDDWIRDLSFVARRYAHLPRFMGIDLYNEPTGEVRWGDGDRLAYKPEYDWKRAAERAGKAVLAANPKLLVFVEGISANWDGVENAAVPINYGENLRPQAYLPLDLPADKLVLAPHSYGPDVYEKSSFSHPDFPRNLEKDWEDLFGRFHPAHALVMGEFGGRYGDGISGVRDRLWQDAFVDYLIKKGIGGFYWCYTPNSHDTGGILDDQLQVREDKMALLRRLWGA